MNKNINNNINIYNIKNIKKNRLLLLFFKKFLINNNIDHPCISWRNKKIINLIYKYIIYKLQLLLYKI